MRDSSHGRIRQQISFLRRQFLQDGGLPFSNVVSEDMISQALTAVSICWLRIYTPLVTLWGFLSQVLSADHSCRAAVACLIAYRLSHGQRPCSSETGAYCQARKRLPFFRCRCEVLACCFGDAGQSFCPIASARGSPRFHT
jgi:hypothetical protein